MWMQNKKKIIYSRNNKILFCDSHDHWTNGICRLLNIENNKAKNWIESIFENFTLRNWSKLKFHEKTNHIIHTTNQFFKSKPKNKIFKIDTNYKILDNEIDFYFTKFKSENKFLHIIGSKHLKHGVLVDSNFKKLSKIKYEEDYFEGDMDDIGYGNYLKQSDWRIQKSKRLLNIILKYIDSNKIPRILDVGAGYGFFRYAAELQSLHHQGIEISKYANKMCNNLFSFSNYEGEVWDYNPKRKFDVITCFDVIEHVSNVDKFIKVLKKMLNKKGLLVVRTPNIFSFEYSCFGSSFYSLKQEHLNYFSPSSLSLFLSINNFDIINIQTSSHMFQGISDFPIDVLKANMNGSDIFLIAKLNEQN